MNQTDIDTYRQWASGDTVIPDEVYAELYERLMSTPDCDGECADCPVADRCDLAEKGPMN